MRAASFDPGRPNWAGGSACVLAAGAFLGLVGPFGSYAAGPASERLFYWTGMLAIGALVYGAAIRSILRLPLRPAATFACLGAVLAVLAAPFGWLVSLAATAFWPRIGPMSPLHWYAQVLVISAPFAVASALFARANSRRNADVAHPVPVDGLLGVSPRAVLCLRMEDHYVRVHTAEGSRLVLATLNQAIAALGGASGLRVHRSWWVAESAVVGVAADGRNLRLRLANGAVAPVARSCVYAVRQAGWIPADPATAE